MFHLEAGLCCWSPFLNANHERQISIVIEGERHSHPRHIARGGLRSFRFATAVWSRRDSKGERAVYTFQQHFGRVLNSTHRYFTVQGRCIKPSIPCPIISYPRNTVTSWHTIFLMRPCQWHVMGAWRCLIHTPPLKIVVWYQVHL